MTSDEVFACVNEFAEKHGLVVVETVRTDPMVAVTIRKDNGPKSKIEIADYRQFDADELAVHLDSLLA
jgi:hypothetical protein